MFYNYSYTPASQSFLFQGTQAELQKKMRDTGAIVLKGDRGSNLMVIPAQGTIYEYPSEDAMEPTRSIIPNKDMIRTRYGKTKVTENDFKKLTDDLNNGNLQFDNLDKGPY